MPNCLMLVPILLLSKGTVLLNGFINRYINILLSSDTPLFANPGFPKLIFDLHLLLLLYDVMKILNSVMFVLLLD